MGDVCEVQKGAVNGGNGDAVNDGAVGIVELAGVVDADPFLAVLGATGDGDVNGAVRNRPQIPEGYSGPVAQERFGAIREHRGRPAGLPCEASVADGIRGTVK